jgi:hypothetical protein
MAIITTVAITALITSLAKKGLEKAFETTGEKLTEGAFNWLKSVFYEEEKPKESVQDLIQNPDSEARKKAVESLINIDLEDHPGNEKFLHEVYEKTQSIETNISIVNSKNVNTGEINTGGGSVRIGDNNGGN